MGAADYDAIVLGGGISALTTALQLQTKGYATAIIDKPAGAGASGLPGGLANPAYGREAKKSWQSEACIESLNRLSELTGDEQSGSAVIKKGILRPAASSAQADAFKNSIRVNGWKQGWTEWLESGEATERFPLVQAKTGALWIPVGMTIDLPGLLSGIRAKLTHLGSTLFSFEKTEVYEGADCHTVISDDREFRSPRIIFAPGSGIDDYPQWAPLKFNRVKGQVVVAAYNGFPDPGCSVASSGYAAFIGRNRVVVGSTYEHTYHNSEASVDTGMELLGRFRKMCPQIAGALTRTEYWAGIRLTTPDRKPCVGGHWKTRGFFCIAGMGSRGLLMAPLAAELLADHIHSGTKLPEEIDIARFYRTRRFMKMT
ncbi:MAG: FAD-binding oxidoreductase [Balneolaceae bacterium]|nr:MAG: FAD-binding oxidoreductase [Balneolaceae bacterium]